VPFNLSHILSMQNLFQVSHLWQEGDVGLGPEISTFKVGGLAILQPPLLSIQYTSEAGLRQLPSQLHYVSHWPVHHQDCAVRTHKAEHQNAIAPRRGESNRPEMVADDNTCNEGEVQRRPKPLQPVSSHTHQGDEGCRRVSRSIRRPRSEVYVQRKSTALKNRARDF
jgi:hypothetical protein